MGVKLCSLVKQIRGVSYKPEDVSETLQSGFTPLLRANNIDSTGTLNSINLIFLSEQKIANAQYLQNGDIVISASSGSIDMVGKAALFNGNEKIAFGAFCRVIRPDKNLILPAYLAYFFQTDYYRKKISSLAQGANIKNIRIQHIDNLELDVPDLETQSKIVTILDKANNLVTGWDQYFKKFEEILRSIFLDMFGDPVINPKSFDHLRLGDPDHFAFSGGGTPERMNAGFYGGEIPWVTPKDMKSDMITTSKIKLTEEGFDSSNAKLVEAFSTLIVVRSGILKHSFPVAISDKAVTINQDLKAIRPKTTTPFFTFWHIKLYGEFLLRKVRAVTADNLDTTVIKKLNILNPPISLQQEFDEIASKYYILQQKVYLQKANCSNLVSSLSQLAFNGNLTFNTAVKLEALLNKIDVDRPDRENDISEVEANNVILNLLLTKLKEGNFGSRAMYNKAKYIAFRILKDGDLINQSYDEVLEEIILAS